MAQLFPDFDTIDNFKVQPTDGERYLLNYLKENLDDTFEVYFQPFINGDRPDIIILKEGAGVLIIEVKDWNLKHYHVGENPEKVWYLTTNHARLLSPLKQVMDYKNNFFNLHISELARRKIFDRGVFGVVSCAIYFHCASRQEALRMCGNSRMYTYILGHDSLSADNAEVDFISGTPSPNVITTCGLNSASSKFDPVLCDQFRRYLRPPLHVMEDGKRIDYIGKQKELIESRPLPQKIFGVAGSGKTRVLAKRVVNAHLRTGLPVLVLTFNKTLVNYIHDRISDVRETFNWNNFHIVHYHRFFRSQANRLGLEIRSIEDYNNINFFSEQATERYASIFIDEIQDFRTEWMRIVRQHFLIQSEGEFVVFGDEKQNVYGNALDGDRRPRTNIPGAPNVLKDAHRFTNKQITDLSLAFQKYSSVIATILTQITSSQLSIRQTCSLISNILRWMRIQIRRKYIRSSPA